MGLTLTRVFVQTIFHLVRGQMNELGHTGQRQADGEVSKGGREGAAA